MISLVAPGDVASDYYEIGLVQSRRQMHSDLHPTLLRGYVQLMDCSPETTPTHPMCEETPKPVSHAAYPGRQAGERCACPAEYRCRSGGGQAREASVLGQERPFAAAQGDRFVADVAMQHDMQTD